MCLGAETRRASGERDGVCFADVSPASHRLQAANEANGATADRYREHLRAGTPLVHTWPTSISVALCCKPPGLLQQQPQPHAVVVAAAAVAVVVVVVVVVIVVVVVVVAVAVVVVV